MSGPKEVSPKATRREAREERLAAALRANLRRRKAATTTDKAGKGGGLGGPGESAGKGPKSAP